MERMLQSNKSEFVCIYGRRRCGKSRLLREVLSNENTVYYTADEREAPLQRASLATEIARILPAFDLVTYPDWEALLGRFWQDAPCGVALAIDEFPFLVNASPELPSLLQKCYDKSQERVIKLIFCGSSQTMMHGLVLDASAPLLGRATEIIKLDALKAGWIKTGLAIDNNEDALTAYTLWGGIPRYWELAADYPTIWEAYQHLVLDSMGVLHQEPERLLHEDLRDPAQAISILALIGQGCHRLSEVAGRLGKPASSLSRPFNKLIELGLVYKDVPFNSNPKKNKQTLYKISDRFLSTWYKFVLPNRSLLERGIIEPVIQSIKNNFRQHLAASWEELVRESIPYLKSNKLQWSPANRWWGTSLEHSQIEIDVVAQSLDGSTLLCGETKLSLAGENVERIFFELERKSRILPFSCNYKKIVHFIFVSDLKGAPVSVADFRVINAEQVLEALRHE